VRFNHEPELKARIALALLEIMMSKWGNDAQPRETAYGLIFVILLAIAFEDVRRARRRSRR
jgi:hypothetical protein